MAPTRLLALALTALTGFSGLVYEVTWEKYLAVLLGSHSEATAAVLGIFLGGLSVGYSVFGRVTQAWVARGRSHRLLVLYGVVEASIGVYVLCFPWIFERAVSISAVLPRGVSGIGFAFDVLLAAILIGPPAVLMGGTIPILTQALSRDTTDATRFHALVYACNTAGAFAGALAAGFVLIPSLGLVRVMIAMGLINLAAGTIFGLLGLRASAPAKNEVVDEGAVEIAGFRSLAIAALLVGFSMMSLQTVFIRVGGLSLGASQFTFSMVVAVFVLCIAVGSFVVSSLSRIPSFVLVVNQWLLVGILIGLYLLMPNAPYAAHVLRTLFRDTEAAFYGYYIAVFLSILVTIGPAVVLSGATLPLLFHHLRQEVGDLGAVAGRLYSWNTVGSLLGALLGGYALLFWLELHHIFQLSLVTLIIAAFMLGSSLGSSTRRVSQVLLVVALFATIVLPNWDPNYLIHGPYRYRQPNQATYLGASTFFGMRSGAKIIFYEDDPVASVGVTEEMYPGVGRGLNLTNNGKSDGNTYKDFVTNSLTAIIPALFADRNKTAFVIGYGTGVSVGELIVLPTIERVIVSEISSAVVKAAPLFDFANHNVTKSPKVEIVQSDAYHVLRHSDEEFDVIVSEPSNPWVQGTEMLYSREFLSAARDRLHPGGVYAQWYHLYGNDQASVELVLRTYAAVFDNVSVWYGGGRDLIILGFRDNANVFNLRRLEERASSPAFKPGLQRSGIESVAELLAHELLPLGVVHAAELTGRLHTLTEPLLGYSAARAFYMGKPADLPFTGGGKAAAMGRKNSLLGRYSSRATGQQLFDGLCGERAEDCVTLLAYWYNASPNSPALAQYIRSASQKKWMFGEKITPELIQRVSHFFSIPGDGAQEESSVASMPRQGMIDYERHYLHALPFSPATLLDPWTRCQQIPRTAEACERGLGRAREFLGLESVGN
jgi:spermidine synthase